MTPRAKRVGWAVVVLLLAVLLFVGATCWEVLAYRVSGSARVETIITGDGPEHEYDTVSYQRWLEPRLSFLARPDGRVVVSWKRKAAETLLEASSWTEHDMTLTEYREDGTVSAQWDGQQQSNLPPWPRPVPYEPSEVLKFYTEAEVYIQDAAARGEITLPDWWEGAK